MRKILLVAVAVVAILALTVGPAIAITDGYEDRGVHPFVGLMVAQDAKGNPLWRCSGTLISAKVFLTAGHCTESPAAHVEIWFTDYVDRPADGKGYPYKGQVGGTPYTHPLYDPNAFYLHDLGVVVLSGKGYPMSTYGSLPELNKLDELHQGDLFTAVGYGLQKSFPDAASWKDEASRTRMVANPEVIQINTPWTGDGSILLSNNTNTGGTCFGDSGGPNFVGTSTIVGAVTSFGLNGTCAGTGGVYRVDPADDLNWLYGTFGGLLN